MFVFFQSSARRGSNETEPTQGGNTMKNAWTYSQPVLARSGCEGLTNRIVSVAQEKVSDMKQQCR